MEKNKSEEVNKLNLLNEKEIDFKKLPPCSFLAQDVPYKNYFAFSNSKAHQTEAYNINTFYKPICKH